MNQAAIRRALRQWVRAHAATPAADAVRDGTPLISSRLITSLQVLDLVLFIEELQGLPIDATMLRPDAFRDIDAICATFFADAPADHAGGPE
jgi:acyl carrier protein